MPRNIHILIVFTTRRRLSFVMENIEHNFKNIYDIASSLLLILKKPSAKSVNV